MVSAERETMEAALVLKRQEIALEREVEMEQKLAEDSKEARGGINGET